MQNQNDQFLLDKYEQTNEQVWLLRLFQKYKHLIYGVCLRYSKDPDWSKDLTQQIYEKLVSRAKDLDTENFIGWLHRLSKNHCLDEIKKKGRRISTLEKFKDLEIRQKRVQFSAEDRLIIEEDQLKFRKAIDEAILTLSAQQQLCLDLFYQQKLSYLQISQETGIDLGQIKSNLQNGRRNIRHYIKSHYKL